MAMQKQDATSLPIATVAVLPEADLTGLPMASEVKSSNNDFDNNTNKSNNNRRRRMHTGAVERPNTTSNNRYSYPATQLRITRVDVPVEIIRMQRRRQRRTMAVGVTGGVVGLVFLGPLGGFLVGYAGAVTTGAIGKGRERRALRKFVAEEAERHQLQQQTHDVPVGTTVVPVVYTAAVL